jgi:hydrogenase-4 membrane subunit HyfE
MIVEIGLRSDVLLWALVGGIVVARVWRMRS